MIPVSRGFLIDIGDLAKTVRKCKTPSNKEIEFVIDKIDELVKG